MAKYINIKIINKNMIPVEEKIRTIRVQGAFALHKKYRAEKGIYSITCLQTGTTILSHLEGQKYGLLCLEQIAETFPDFDFENEDHKREIWKYIKRNYYRKEIFG